MRLRYFSSAFALLYFPFHLQAQVFDSGPARVTAEIVVVHAETQQPIPDARGEDQRLWAGRIGVREDGCPRPI